MAKTTVSSGIMERHSVFFIAMQMIFILLLLHVIEVKASFGDACTSALSCTTPEETCTTDGSPGTCTCSLQYYEDTSDPNAVICKDKIQHGATCDPDSSSNADAICEEVNVTCIESEVSPDRCLCKDQYYRNPANTQCRLFEELGASNLQLTNRTTDEIRFTWTGDKHGTEVDYTIQVSAFFEQVQSSLNEASNPKTGIVSRLTPGSQYSIVIQTTLPGNSLYSQQQNFSILAGVWTLPAKPGNVVEVKLAQADSVRYNITITASEGRVVSYRMSINGETKQISGVFTTFTFTSLEPEQIYAYTLRAYNGNGDASEPATGTISTSSAGISHGETCDPSTPSTSNCREENTECIKSGIGEDRCLCTYDYYRSADDTACRPLTELKVSNIVAQANTTTITLIWKADTHGTNVEYVISSNIGAGVGTVTGNKAVIPDLTPGTVYSFYVLSVLPSNDLYNRKTQSESKPAVWTPPAKPGSVSDVELVSEDPLQYEVTFLPSQGRVDHYTVMVGGESGDATDTTTTFLFRTLQPGRSYSYTVKAFNENGDESEPSTGNLETTVIAAGPVSNLTVSDITTTGATASWRKPAGSNNAVRGYTLTVRQLSNSSCVYGYQAVCSDCPTSSPSGDISACETMNSESKTVGELNSETGMFSVAIGSLRPYHNYSITVTANTEQGIGIVKRVSFRTSIAAARNVTNVVVTSARSPDSDSVSLTVTWTAGDFTGPTTVVIHLEEETSLDSNSFRTLSTETVTGYNNQAFTKSNVLAYWRYRVSVLAMTEAGNSSWVGPILAQTTTITPGGIRNISVVQDDTVAQEMILTFVCPQEKKRNGRITRYVIRKTLLDSTGETAEQNEYPVVPSSSSTCENTYRARDVGGIQVGRTYTFAIKVENQDFNGTFSDVETVRVEPKAPLLSALILSAHGVTAFTKKSSGTATQDTAIAIIVCSSCLLDDRQGRVERVGLIVCVVGDDGLCSYTARRRRSAVQFEDFTTWGKASQLGFTQVYRATPEAWIGDLNTVSNSYTYIVGADGDCSQESDTVFCNGPLPAGATIRIAAIQCNAVGCVLGTFEGPFAAGSQESENDDSDDDALKIGIGVAVAVVVVLIIVIIIIIIIYRRRRARQAKKIDGPYNTIGANMKDAHLYYGVGGNQYTSSSNDQRVPDNRVSMAGLSQSSGTDTLPQKKDDDDYLEPDHYDFIGAHILSESGDKRSSALSGQYDGVGDQQRFSDIYYDELQRARYGDKTEGYQNL